LRVLVRFLPVFGPYFALFSSMSCACLYVNNFFPASLAWELPSLQRSPEGPFLTWGGRRERPPPKGSKGNRDAAGKRRKAGMEERRNNAERSPEGPFLTWGGSGARRGGERAIAESGLGIERQPSRKRPGGENGPRYKVGAGNARVPRIPLAVAVDRRPSGRGF
jgi:hypothetical protein